MSIIQAWERNGDENTCTVCDSRTFCPTYRDGLARKNGELQPRVTSVKD
ncbi:hypothetical protein PATSB16_40050 [Pandoraea thiooxydans]|nr:hypothetical protein PATSB16_40050 [Pandoraea thiooxydans]